MDHLGAEIGQLEGLLVGHMIEHKSLGHAPRIGRQHAVDIGPDVDLGGIEQGAEDARRVVAAVAAERGDALIGQAPGDETGDHVTLCRMQAPELAEAFFARQPFHRDMQLGRRDPQHLARIEEFSAMPKRAEMRRQHLRRPHFAEAGHQFDDLGRHGAEQFDAAQQVRQIGKADVERAGERGRLVTQQLRRRIQMPLLQRRQFRRPVAAAGGRAFGHADQRIGDTLHRRHDDHLGLVPTPDHELSNRLIPGSVGNAGPAEFVGDPPHEWFSWFLDAAKQPPPALRTCDSARVGPEESISGSV